MTDRIPPSGLNFQSRPRMTQRLGGGLLSFGHKLLMMTPPQHKVFVSYHHANDQLWRDQFENLFAGSSGEFLSKSVQIGDIAPGLQTDTIRQKTRNSHGAERCISRSLRLTAQDSNHGVTPCQPTIPTGSQ